MNKKLMFIGFGATLAFILCFGSGQSAAPQSSDSGGRYRMFSPNPGGGISETYVIDTQTGRIWKQTFYTDIRGFYMVPQPYLTADGLAASAVPTDTVSLESLSLQKKYDAEIEKARAKTSESK
jgi:hypothetical protein